MKDILELFDGTQLEIEDGASLNRIVVIAENETDAVSVCNKITDENVSRVQFIHEGNVTATYTNLVINFAPIRQTNEDQTVTVIISLREKTSIEYRLDALEESQEVQDGAIEDLGLVISDLVEGE